MIATEDRVVVRGHWTGTHQGEFMGIPPTGKQVQVSYIDIWVVENDQLMKNWVEMDMLGMLRQLGVAPTPGHVD
jgi:predicted ester cyclase